MEQRLEVIYNRLRSISSAKTKLNKNPKLNRAKIAELLLEEDTLKRERAMIKAPKKTFTTLTAEEIGMLDYEETRRALESIRSKLSNERHSEDQAAFNEAKTIHDALLAHREQLQPTQKITKALLHTLLEQDPEPASWLHKKLRELINQP
jgi:hypothetical protein